MKTYTLVRVTPEHVTVVVSCNFSSNAHQSNEKSISGGRANKGPVEEHTDGINTMRSMVVVESSILVNERLEGGGRIGHPSTVECLGKTSCCEGK